MKPENKSAYLLGIKHGWPIGVGYFAVSFALGIAARNAGFTALQATAMSALCSASAGQFAGITLANAGASYLEMAAMELIVNARYLLMSTALTQKLDPKLSTGHRLILANYVTDEIFGLSVTVPGKLNPFYSYGLITMASPGWTFGTCLGVIMGNVLPANIVSALSVGLYGMFLAIIIPPTRKSGILACLVPVSMAMSWLFTRMNDLGIFKMSGGNRIIFLTVFISLIAAIFFPHKEEAAAEAEIIAENEREEKQ
jgi:predicted branched-subunit amino acid permease